MSRLAEVQMAQDRAITWPSAATTVSLVSAISPAWSFGAWVQLVASSSVPCMIVGFAGTTVNATTNGGVLQIGTGGAGSETAIVTLPVRCESAAGLLERLPVGVYVPSGTRIAARWAEGEAAGNFTIGHFRALAVTL